MDLDSVEAKAVENFRSFILWKAGTLHMEDKWNLVTHSLSSHPLRGCDSWWQ